jgi:hypothetical protein
MKAVDKQIPDPESQNAMGNNRLSYIQLMLDYGEVDDSILKHPYSGSGTPEDPFIVDWLENDPRNPMLFGKGLKWLWTMLVAFSTFTVAFTTSAYTAAPTGVLEEFQVSHVLFALGLSVFVLGLALGPLVWAPLSELYGRQIIFTLTLSL